MERKQYEVVIKLISNQSPCHVGHKIGQEWVFNYFTPPAMCGLAYNAIYPAALALSVGGTFPWQEDPDVLTLSCPDYEVNNVFELRRRPVK
ncbi:MAG: hypothetical protein A2Y89_00510 [Chloroflexi bacterium RBG_13_51_18]|nr:MAG: hypothetical protein A2Y89_00510 [Chloroflexi bacterium RBG_13_51_18]